MVPSLGTCFLVDHLAFLSNTGVYTSQKLSLPSFFEGTLLSKVGSTLSKALLFTGSDRVSIAEGHTMTVRSGPSSRSISADNNQRLCVTFSYTGEVVVVSFYNLLSCSFPFVRVVLQHNRFVCRETAEGVTQMSHFHHLIK